ncbi:muscarinic acetylcholine receptor M5-like [Sinocyclocheilus anshuiensis]|uniref:muscarinic acetylcholine receptor M5-like n=1 Tax=Sinocyclocheilus anshuiensis TaxID=1608454 RepID=UPI0007B7F78F|nr:PREDICTED: muscarinic acetylcholine receptor M5-like [Sinocyclocheilus anshuiensis]
MNMDIQNLTASGNVSAILPAPYSLLEVITIATVSAVVSLITILGNVLVMLSFKVNSQLKTVNNYYLLSLAFADLIIGVFSMNLYTSYILMGYWSLGNIACDLWLALDYVASNASVMNLLVISFDRYFSITRPLTYRAKRTPKRAGIMIGLAWLISFILWAPPILCWQYFIGERTVPTDQCQIQFFSEPIITFGTAIAAFYVPVSIMTILYCKIYKETEKRTKNLAELQGYPSLDSHEDPKVRKPILRCFSFKNKRDGTQASWSSSNQSYVTRTTLQSEDLWTKSDQVSTLNSYTSSEDDERSVSETTPRESFKNQESTANRNGQLLCYEDSKYLSDLAKCSQTNNKKCMSYKFKPILSDITALQGSTEADRTNTDHCQSSVPQAPSSTSSSTKPEDPNLKIQMTKRKRMVLIKEKKAAQTLSAILLVFLLTWTPYNIMVLISTFCSECIPVSLWHLGYWLCYVNSTINPMCYALCNKTFQKTFWMLVLCKWKKNRGEEKLYWCGQNH